MGIGYHKEIGFTGDPTDIQGLGRNPNPRMFVEIIERKKLDVSRVVSGVSTANVRKV